MKTACEEAADLYDSFGFYYLPDTLAKRLRAEGRELKRLRKLVVDGARPLEKDAATKWMADMDREATRIQQARKK